MAYLADDHHDWIDDVSAWLDGEVALRPVADIEAHVATCDRCTEFVDVSANHKRAVTMRAVPSVRSDSHGVSRRFNRAVRSGQPVVLLGLLAVVSVQIFIMSIADLMSAGSTASHHDIRHVGAYGVAYAVALASVVQRPSRARAILPVAMVSGGALGVTAVVDVVNTRVPLVAESAHLPQIISIVLVWALASRNSRPIPAPHDQDVGAKGS